MKTIVWHTILAGLLLFGNACEKEQWDDCFSRAGKSVTLLRPLENFTQIEVSDAFNIQLTQDSLSEPTIELTGPENLLEGIQTEVTEGKLIISNKNICNFVRSYGLSFDLKINIHNINAITAIGNSVFRSTDTLHLQRLNITQSATNEFDLTITADKVTVQTIDAGVFTLRGRANSLNGSIERVSELDARHLACKEVLVDSHTPLDIYVNGQKVVFVKIFNSGNIYFKGMPSEKLELNERVGSGQLLPLK